MMRYLLTSLLILVSGFVFAQDYSRESPSHDCIEVPRDSSLIDGMVVYTNPDERAQFVGGHAEMKKFIEMNINYPPYDGGLYCEQKVYLQFIILKDGSIPEVKIIRGANDCDECDKEAIRLVKSMPPWIPAKVNGQPVNSFFNLPIKFGLH